MNALSILFAFLVFIFKAVCEKIEDQKNENPEFLLSGFLKIDTDRTQYAGIFIPTSLEENFSIIDGSRGSLENQLFVPSGGNPDDIIFITADRNKDIPGSFHVIDLKPDLAQNKSFSDELLIAMSDDISIEREITLINDENEFSLNTGIQTEVNKTDVGNVEDTVIDYISKELMEELRSLPHEIDEMPSGSTEEETVQTNTEVFIDETRLGDNETTKNHDLESSEAKQLNGHDHQLSSSDIQSENSKLVKKNKNVVSRFANRFITRLRCYSRNLGNIVKRFLSLLRKTLFAWVRL
jgi:hypothetical protein